jgi:hypothetical protein
MGQTLLIQPAYPHLAEDFVRDPTPTLPVSLLYAGEFLERRGHQVRYFDCQLRDLNVEDVSDYDTFGVTVMGAQNIVSAYFVYKSLTSVHGINPERILLGGQGVEYLTSDEFSSIFPGSVLIPRSESTRDQWDVNLARQIGKIDTKDLSLYLTNELTLPFSQNCAYACTFCAAANGRQERFYDTKGNLEIILKKANGLGIRDLKFYVTSLDFFQQALGHKDQDVSSLAERLESIVELSEKYGIKTKLRALTRIDSYNAAMESQGLLGLVKSAGFYQFGFGVDGTSSIEVLRKIKKRIKTEKGSPEQQLWQAFSHCTENGFTAENLSVIGVRGQTSAERLADERDLCIRLLQDFPSSVLRIFPAKDEIPGSVNWRSFKPRKPEAHTKLFLDPIMFLNLGYETFANCISHPDQQERRTVNHYVVEIGSEADEMGQLESCQTIPIMETDGHELMSSDDLGKYVRSIEEFVPEIASSLTVENLPQFRQELNGIIPRDK